MTDATSPLIAKQGKLRRALAGFWAFLEGLESGGSGYTFDRIESLERDVARLKEELRQSRDSRQAEPQH